MVVRRSLSLLLITLAVALFGAIGSSSSVSAQTTDEGIKVIGTTPRNGAVLNATPSQIILEFAAALPELDASVLLQNADNEPQSIGQPVTIELRKKLKVVVTRELPPGEYTVRWLLKPRTGPTSSGEIKFKLEAPAVTTTVAENTTPEVKPDTGGLGIKKTDHYGGFLGVVGRTLSFLGLAGLAGALLLIVLAWNEGVEYVLTVRHLWLSWLLGVLGTLLAVATAAADAKGVIGEPISVARAMLPTEWGTLLDSTFGKALVVRLLAIAACAYVAGRPERAVDSSNQLVALGLPAVALASYGWSRPGDDIDVLAIPAGIVHMAAVAAWFGGAALLTRVVLAGPGEEDLVQAVRGFRRIAVPALLLALVSGAVQTQVFLGGLGNLFDTTFGRIFVLKMMAVAVMAFVGTANRQFARQRLGRARRLEARPADRLRRSIRTEIAAGALVFLLTGWLAGTAAPGTGEVSAATANKDTFVSSDGTFAAELTFGPKRVGALVEFHFRLKRPDSIKSGLVTFTPQDGKSPSIEVPIAGSPNYGFGPRQGFQFGSSGTWVVTITGTGPDGPLPTISREFTVNNADGSPPRSPTTTAPGTTAPTSGSATSSPASG